VARNRILLDLSFTFQQQCDSFGQQFANP
jgi:hypothetical protein